MYDFHYKGEPREEHQWRGGGRGKKKTRVMKYSVWHVVAECNGGVGCNVLDIFIIPYMEYSTHLTEVARENYYRA